MRSGRSRAFTTFLLVLGASWAPEARFAGAEPDGRAAFARPGRGPTTASANAPASAPAHPATFRIATFNVLYENRDLKAVAETIRKSDADVAILQETNAGSEKYLREQLGKTYPHAAFHAGGGGAGGLGILSKTPLRSIKVLPARFGWFGTQVCEANLAGRSVQLVNAHLIATIPPAGASAAEILRLWDQREAIRAKEIAYILDSTDPDRPRLIGGDLNALPSGTAPRFLLDKGFVDGLASARRDHDKVATWSGGLGPLTLRARVDYIFHTKDIQSMDCQVLPCAGSDHSLVVSTLRWAPEEIAPAATSPAGVGRQDADTRPTAGRIP